MARASRTDASAWIDAAWSRFRNDGLPAVRVEAIARELGATKGSFYWHFADRRVLVDAVMARWEQEQTDAFIAAADAEPDPRQRVRRLFEVVGARRAAGEHRLYAAAEAEGVAEVVERVSARRVDYIRDALVECGIAPEVARRRAVVALATTLGLEQLARGGAASVIGDTEALHEAMLAFVLDPAS